MKNIMIISDHSPFDGMHIRDALDMTLIFAAIDQNVSWLFQGSAVMALKPKQSPQQLGIKDFFKSIKTLEIYDVENIYVCETALKQFKLDPDQLSIDVTVISQEQQRQLLDQQDQVVTL
ncbi:sulfurtransferase complex subunit TusC [Pseudoalteromonas aurantia]|uniref:tRNA 2-thiouridine synthesizing protein C n=1 Tax=Pseudoalteromonas aurantia 208 TaxID=1314867 RepID=A0ABR9EA38_9GAMM|nr:sulfurtransferase complex subunit TusC [Pseudoalteromonas aurantia]MBE0367845.1 tRNA 2-thiouridine synthesizing protein C [Pseudoalteromonas aurantia 208]